MDGVPAPPEGGLNELVPGQAAKEGDVAFVIPRGTPGVRLRIAYASDSTEIPLALPSQRQAARGSPHPPEPPPGPFLPGE